MHSGTPLGVVLGMLRAGEPIEAIASDFDLSGEEVAEVARREGMLAA